MDSFRCIANIKHIMEATLIWKKRHNAKMVESTIACVNTRIVQLQLSKLDFTDIERFKMH